MNVKQMKGGKAKKGESVWGTKETSVVPEIKRADEGEVLFQNFRGWIEHVIFWGWTGFFASTQQSNGVMRVSATPFLT